MKILQFPDQQEFLTASLRFFEDIFKTARQVNIALSGGQTPLPLYQALAKSNFPFDKITFYQVDERYLPHDDPHSNYRMIFDNLVSPTAAKFHYFDTGLPLSEALKKYSEEISNITFDLTILGIGSDGHFASLFPNSPALNEKQALTAHTVTDQFDVKDRLTLTPPPILASKNILVLLQNKPEVLAEIKNPQKTPEQFPAHLLQNSDNTTIHYY